ncbi:MAG: DUF1292 domain-containing protein [Clostridiales bacterium]|nr:DUF1292 domain-containing protein [Clostridiales bacterium]
MNTVVLLDDDDQEHELDFLASIELDGEKYMVLSDVFYEDEEYEEDEAESEDQDEYEWEDEFLSIIIMKVENQEGAEVLNLISVTDQKVLDEVFDIFKTNYSNEFRFADSD